MRSGKVSDLAFISISAALMAVSAWITVPGPVPFTMQTFALFTVLLTLGGRRGLKAVLVYIFLGIIGLPVFSGFQGGIGVIFSSTGGFIIGFIAIAVTYLLCERFADKNTAVLFSVMSAGLALCYIIGSAWFYFVYSKGAEISFAKVLSLCVLPFIIPDLLKSALAVLISRRIKPFISKIC